jgi:excisionase family DNA binding protein
MTELKCLTTREVARLCRVSDATVKRWEDAGLLKSERTNGGHRRFRPAEIARFQREQNLCEEEAANKLISASLQGKTLTEIFDELICPAMRRIGELWYDGDLSVTQEHIATRAASNAIYKLRNVLPVSKVSGELAMCCALEGDFHEFPTHLAQMTIENEGWEVLNFGANTPLYCLADEVMDHLPEMICISATILNDVERISRDYKTFVEQIGKLKIPIVLGGRAFNDEQIKRRFPCAYFVRNFTEVAEITQSLTKKN